MDPITQQVILAAAGAAGASEDYWIATLGGSVDDVGKGIDVDSSGNVYVIGDTSSSGAGSNDALIAKYDESGVIQWQRTLGGSGYENGMQIKVDSSSNAYLIGQTQSGGQGVNDYLIAKYNSSGTLQWSRTLGGSSGDVGNGIAVDSSANVYVIGYHSFDFKPRFGFAKYNSSGAIQWQRTLGTTSESDVGHGIDVDSSGNVYVFGETNSSGAGGDDFLFAKYNSSGTIQWQHTLGGSNDTKGRAGVVDSSGNVYIAGYTNSAGAGSFDLLVAKYNTSGVIQWQRTLGGTSSERGNAIAVDSSGNVYVSGLVSSAGAGSNDFLIVKYNTSGVIQWQRMLGGTGNDVSNGIAVDGSGNVYVNGTTTSAGNNQQFLIAKLPGDGSLTGTYGSFTYASSSLTDASSSLTDASSTLTSAASSETDASISLTSSSSSLTSSTTTL